VDGSESNFHDTPTLDQREIDFILRTLAHENWPPGGANFDPSYVRLTKVGIAILWERKVFRRWTATPVGGSCA